MSTPQGYGGFGSQLFGGLPVEGALLGPHLLLLVLQLLGYTDVVLHQLVLLDVGGVVLLNCRVEEGRVSGDGCLWDPKVSHSKEACTAAALLTLLLLQVVRQRSVLQHGETLAH